MYLSREPEKHHKMYFDLVNDVVKAAPSTLIFIEDINNHILTGALYKALKAGKALIEYERTLLSHASRSAGVRVDGQGDGHRQSA